jgi:hypothetical protein
MKTTLNKIRAYHPCRDGWEKLLCGLGKTAADDEVIWIDQILDHNGVNDALWCLRAVENCDREIRLYAVWCARRVQRHMTDPRSIAAFAVAERRARGEASDEELASARGLAWAAARAVAYAAATHAAVAHAAAAHAAAYMAAACAAKAAYMAAWEAAAAAAVRAGARDTERAAQAEELRRICREMRESGR